MLSKCIVLVDLRADLPDPIPLDVEGSDWNLSQRPQLQALQNFKKFEAFIYACFEGRKLVLESLDMAPPLRPYSVLLCLTRPPLPSPAI